MISTIGEVAMMPMPAKSLTTSNASFENSAGAMVKVLGVTSSV